MNFSELFFSNSCHGAKVGDVTGLQGEVRRREKFEVRNEEMKKES